MDVVILICCILIIVLLMFLIGVELRKDGNNGTKIDTAIDFLQDQNQVISEQLYRQQEMLRSEQNDMKREIGGRIEKLERTNRESLERINSTVGEKFQNSLDEKLSHTNNNVVNVITKFGDSLRDEQGRQQRAVTDKLSELQNGFDRIRNDLISALDKMHESNSANIDKLREENKKSLEEINGTVNEKLQKTLNERIDRSFETVNKRLQEVYEGLGEMKNVASGVSDLKNVLSNVKTRGIIGEIQLEAILDDILPQESYLKQTRVKPNSREMVDFAVKLPGNKNGEYILLPIDSKFPADTYRNLMNAYESGIKADITEKRKQLEKTVKNFAKDISAKYIEPPYTTDFAIMFLPFEGLYSEVVNMGMVEELQRDFKINIAGPSTMAAMLNSLKMGFRTLAIQKKSGEVWKILEDVRKEFSKFEQTLKDTKNKLQKVDKDLDELIGTRTRAINRKLDDVADANIALSDDADI